jgi:1-pyrroline-5-carboxylate dehydrogenase
VRERVAKLTVGDPATNPNLGPVVNQSALDSMLAYIETGKKEGRLIAGGNAPQTEDGGYFLEPTVFADIAPDAVLAQEEIFGPVLAMIKVKDFAQGLAVANNTEYGLTGSIYSTDREKLDVARREFHVGNLYFNRKCTGAMVGAHPFGGFNMSGTDSKAGGPDYLYLFTQAKSVGEKL